MKRHSSADWYQHQQTACVLAAYAFIILVRTKHAQHTNPTFIMAAYCLHILSYAVHNSIVAATHLWVECVNHPRCVSYTVLVEHPRWWLLLFVSFSTLSSLNLLLQSTSASDVRGES
jgi:hypothetical protein